MSDRRPTATGCGGCKHADAIAAHREAKTSGLVPVGGLNPADRALWETIRPTDDPEEADR